MTQQGRELLPHLAMLAVIGIATLLLAFWPQPMLGSGYQCMLHALTGLRCPFCGMTRDFADLLHGGRGGLNPCSRMVALVVYGAYPAAVVAAWRTGRLRWFHSRAMRVSLAVVLGLMMLANNWH